MEYQQKNPLKYYTLPFYLNLLIRYTSKLFEFLEEKAMSALFRLIIIFKKGVNVGSKGIMR
jgi:hypothetical protein